MAKPLTAEIPAELDGERADKVVAVLAGVSRARAAELVARGEVRVDGLVVSGRNRVPSGAWIEFPAPPPPEELEPEVVDFDVAYEDADLLAVDKPAGLVVHPGAGRRHGTLAAGLLTRFPELRGVGEEGRWGLVHRLDRDTSGLLLVAKSMVVHRALTEALRRRRIQREYLALVQGTFSIPRGTIDAPIGTDPRRPMLRALVPDGRPSVTHYRLRRQWSEPGVALLDVTLETGRTHQIRVHLAGIGHPVIGDRQYGGRDPIRAPRLFLHARLLRFEHPVSKTEIEIESPLPVDLRRVLDELDSPAAG